ncbi:MAG: hypothetical protein WCH76_06415 [Candidatus Riflemargulisbacteria bacterium]
MNNIIRKSESDTIPIPLEKLQGGLLIRTNVSKKESSDSLSGRIMISYTYDEVWTDSSLEDIINTSALSPEYILNQEQLQYLKSKL